MHHNASATFFFFLYGTCHSKMPDIIILTKRNKCTHGETIKKALTSVLSKLKGLRASAYYLLGPLAAVMRSI